MSISTTSAPRLSLQLKCDSFADLEIIFSDILAIMLCVLQNQRHQICKRFAVDLIEFAKSSAMIRGSVWFIQTVDSLWIIYSDFSLDTS